MGEQIVNRLKVVSSWVWANTDSLTKWLQVTALISAALWTYFRFRTSEAPGLETPPTVSMILNWTWRPDPPSSGSCWVSTQVEVNDVGVTSFEVTKIRLKTWHQDLRLQPDKLNFIDVPQIEAAPPAVEVTPKSPIIRRFAPKVDIHDAFTWIVDGRPVPGFYVFYADIEDKRGAVLGSANGWTDRLCQ
jgi:hypothetical protein